MNTQKLSEGWTFTKPGCSPEQVRIPHTWNNLDGQDGGNDYFRGCCTYETDLNITAREGMDYYLEFEGVNSVTAVSVNGKAAGSHTGGYSTFRCLITELLDPSGRQKVRVEVDNSHDESVYPLMADFTFMGGMYRPVNLIEVPKTRISLDHLGSEGVYIHQNYAGKDRADLTVEVLVTAAEGTEEDSELCIEVQLSDAAGHTVASASAAVDPSSAGQLSGVTSTVPLPDGDLLGTAKLSLAAPHLWDGIRDPYLYTLTVELRSGGVPADVRRIPVGIRSFSVDPDRGFILNGRAMTLRGVSRHQDREDRGWALETEDHAEDLQIIADMGADSIRLAHYQQSRDVYTLADAMGFVVWAEIPFISRMSKEDLTGENARSQLVELILQNYNHPSICMWGVQNEITIAGKDDVLEGVVKSLHELAKQIDPARPSAQAQVGHHPEEDSLNRVTDIFGGNWYHGWYYNSTEALGDKLDSFHAKHPEIPIGITEYGAEGILDYHTDKPEQGDYTEEYHRVYHQTALRIISERPFLWGTYVWNMFDFASDLRDEGGVKGRNNKGLVTHDRKVKKDAFYVYQARWSSSPVIRIAEKRFQKRKRGPYDVTVLSNCESVELFVNGISAGIVQPSDCAAVFPGVSFSEDSVLITAMGSSSGTREVPVTDSALFLCSDEHEPSYTCKEKKKGLFGDVVNWFAEEEGSDAEKPFTFPEGMFSIRVPIEEMMADEACTAVLEEQIPKLLSHSMLDMIKRSSIEELSEMSPGSFPRDFLRLLNEKLTAIPRK
jgi:beta-galactosidase